MKNALLILAALLATAPAVSFAGEQTWSGKIADSACGAKHEEADRGIRDLEERKNLRRDLDEQPAHRAVTDRSAIHVPPFQLGKKFLKIHGQIGFAAKTPLPWLSMQSAPMGRRASQEHLTRSSCRRRSNVKKSRKVRRLDHMV